MIKGVIFDIDGTLLDSMPLWNNLGERYLQKLGFTEEETEGLSHKEGIFSGYCGRKDSRTAPGDDSKGLL